MLNFGPEWTLPKRLLVPVLPCAGLEVTDLPKGKDRVRYEVSGLRSSAFPKPDGMRGHHSIDSITYFLGHEKAGII